MSPDHSLTNKKGNLLATSTSKIDIKTLSYFHQNKCSFTKWQPEFGGGYGQLACWVGAATMMDNIGISKYHKQVISSMPPLTRHVSTEPIGSAQICSSTVACTKSLRRRTHISPRPWIISQLPRNRTWVGSILSHFYHWFLMFRRNDVGKNKSFWNEWNITWSETHACYFLSFLKHATGETTQ